jgi:hypothetical protein
MTQSLFSGHTGGGSSGLPIRPEVQPLAVEWTELSRSIEGQHVVSTLNCRASPLHMHLLGRSIEAGMDDDEGAPGIGVIYAMQVAWQSRMFRAYPVDTHTH